ATVRLLDLQEERLLFRTNCDLGDFFLDSCRGQGFEPRIVYRGARESWVQAMIASGFGVAVMPEFSHTNVATVARPLVDPNLVRELSLVTVAGRRQQSALTRLIRTFGSHGRREEALDRTASLQLMMASKSIRSSGPVED